MSLNLSSLTTYGDNLADTSILQRLIDDIGAEHLHIITLSDDDHARDLAATQVHMMLFSCERNGVYT